MATLMSLEDLSERSGVPSRTIRYYQTQKLLQKPLKDPDDGRVARYDDDHLERLRLIGELHDRGLKLPGIKELLDSRDAAGEVSDWLGLRASLGGSWSTEEPRLITDLELDEMLEGTPPGTRGTLESSGMLQQQGSSWLASSPSRLTLTIGLISDGIDADLALAAGHILRTHLRSASGELMTLFQDALRAGFGDGADPGELLQPLRPMAGDAARLIFAQELERAIADLLANPKRLKGR